MIQRFDVSGVHMHVDDDLRKYATKKIGRLDRFVPRRSRDSLHVSVKLKESKAKDKKERECEVIMRMPQETFTVSESTINMYAAIDIVETRLRNHLKKYKELHSASRPRRRFAARWQRVGEV